MEARNGRVVLVRRYILDNTVYTKGLNRTGPLPRIMGHLIVRSRAKLVCEIADCEGRGRHVVDTSDGSFIVCQLHLERFMAPGATWEKVEGPLAPLPEGDHVADRDGH